MRENRTYGSEGGESGLNGLPYPYRAVAVSHSVDAHSLQHCQPHIAQRGVLRQDEMLAQLEVGSAAGENRWAIGEVMDRADV